MHNYEYMSDNRLINEGHFYISEDLLGITNSIEDIPAI